MDQAAEGNFVTEIPETALGSSSEADTAVMDSNENIVEVVPDIKSKYMKVKTGNAKSKIQKDKTKKMAVASVPEILETAPGSSSEADTAVMDSNENIAEVVPDIQSKYMKVKTGNAKSKIQKDKTKKMTVASVPEIPETAPGSSSEADTAVMDSNENIVEVVPDIQSKYMKVKTGNAKSKIQKDKTKKMAVESVPERKSLKRKVAHPPTSEMVMESIKALKKRNGASFEDIRKYMEEKYVVDMRLLKYHINKFLQKSVDNGVLEKIGRDRGEGRFKIKKSEDIKKDPKTLPSKEGKVKPEKKMAATKKQVKK